MLESLTGILQQCREHILKNLLTAVLNNASGIQAHDSKAVAASSQLGPLHVLRKLAEEL